MYSACSFELIGSAEPVSLVPKVLRLVGMGASHPPHTFVGTGDWNSGSQACRASYFLAEGGLYPPTLMLVSYKGLLL